MFNGQRSWWPPIGAGAFGVVVFQWCVGWSTVNPSSFDWLFIGGIDPSTHVIGWHTFRSAPWDFPLGKNAALGHPVGTSIALTDSIPLVAIPLKAIRGVLPSDFQYFGAWLLACFVLQGVFGARLVSAATGSTVHQLLGGALFVLSPILSHRLGHNALCAHWIVLAGLSLNRQADSAVIGRGELARWILLTAIAAATHPYLTVMVLAVAFASVFSRLRKSWWAVAQVVGVGGIIAGTAIAMWWICGYFIVPDSAALQTSGFGQLSMNLLSPLVPPPGALTFGRIPFSLAWPDQQEGFSYFGLGMFLLFLAALALMPRLRWTPTRSDLMLAVACAALTLFAVSSIVTFGTRIVARYSDAVWGPLSTFRSSGRMFWPVYYATCYAAISLVATRLRFKSATAILVIAATLQAADMAGVYRMRRAGFATRGTDPIPNRFWDVVPKHYRHIVLYPSNMCAPYEQSIDFRYFAVHAGYAGATINGGFAARFDVDAVQRYCQRFSSEMQQGVVSDDTLYVVGAGLEPLLLRAQTPVMCMRVDGFGACFTAHSHENWRQHFDIKQLGAGVLVQ